MTGASVPVPASLCDRFEEIVAEIELRRHRHIAILIGSAASFPAPTRCPSVGRIRNEMILGPLLEHICRGSASSAFSGATVSLLESACAKRWNGRYPVPLHWDVEALPFEQFMGRLHKASPAVADKIVEIACGPEAHGKPNHNHIAAVLLSACILAGGKADRVSILTTNYDLGLERAICTFLKGTGKLTPISGIDDFVPALFARLPSGRLLQLVKLHGCVERGRLVYAFSQMRHLVFDTDGLLRILAELSAETSYPTLYLTIGYSFSDPDLRPMFLDAFSRVHTLVYCNEQPPDPTSDSPDVLRGEHLARTGPVVLQKEFFTKVAPMIHHSDLNRRDGPVERVSLLVRLARHFLNGADLPLAATEEEPVDGNGAAAAIQQLCEPQVVAFLGGLVDACARSDALVALKVALRKPSGLELRGETTRLYLSQFGHAHRMADAAKACVRLRRQHREPVVRLIAGAYRSLALSIGPPGLMHINQLRAPLPLLRVLRLRAHVDPAWQVFYQHHALHYWTKLVEVLSVALSRLLGRLGHWAGRAALRRIADRLDACLRTALDSADLETVADVQSLLVEVRIILGDDAVSFATRNRQIRAALGTLNRVALVERQLGWANLSENTDQNRDEAVRAFARGLWLATYSNDASLEPKLTADLVRSVYAGRADDLEASREEPASDEVTAVRDICQQIGLGQRPVCDLIVEDARRMLVRHLRFLYSPDDKSVLGLVKRNADTARNPVLLAPDPPRIQIRATQPLHEP